jgi:hypothetical protein
MNGILQYQNECFLRNSRAGLNLRVTDNWLELWHLRTSVFSARWIAMDKDSGMRITCFGHKFSSQKNQWTRHTLAMF